MNHNVPATEYGITSYSFLKETKQQKISIVEVERIKNSSPLLCQSQEEAGDVMKESQRVSYFSSDVFLFPFLEATLGGPGGGYHALGKMLIGLILQVTKNWLQALSDYTRASASPPAPGPHEVLGRPVSCRTSRHLPSLASLPLYGILQRLIKPSCFVPFLIWHPVGSFSLLTQTWYPTLTQLLILSAMNLISFVFSLGSLMVSFFLRPYPLLVSYIT